MVRYIRLFACYSAHKIRPSDFVLCTVGEILYIQYAKPSEAIFFLIYVTKIINCNQKWTELIMNNFQKLEFIVQRQKRSRLL